MRARLLKFSVGILLIIGILIGASLASANPKPQLPRPAGIIPLAGVPAGIFFQDGNLYVTYKGQPIVDVLYPTGISQFSFNPSVTGKPLPEGVASINGQLAVTDSTKGTLGFFDSKGKLLDGFYQAPDGSPIRPRGIFPYKEVYYLTDLSLPGWRAVHRSGEVLLSFKGTDEKSSLVEPYGIVVTSDARAIVSDPALGKVKVYSCSGWYVYDFDQGPQDKGLKQPYGLALDSLDRIHVVDRVRQKVFVYSNLGQLLFTYDVGIANPQSIAIDRERRTIYITGDSNVLEVRKY